MHPSLMPQPLNRPLRVYVVILSCVDEIVMNGRGLHLNFVNGHEKGFKFYFGSTQHETKSDTVTLKIIIARVYSTYPHVGGWMMMMCQSADLSGQSTRLLLVLMWMRRKIMEIVVYIRIVFPDLDLLLYRVFVWHSATMMGWWQPVEYE